jgi:predicted GH43/DUF377 family glycosyl hydrolase
MEQIMKLVIRYKNNPILTKNDVPYEVATVYNAGVTKYRDEYIMLFRSNKHNGRSILGLARSADGFNFKVEEKPFMEPAKTGVFAEYEAFGVEDPRITFIDNEYLITYSAYSQHGVRIGLAKTQDWKSVKRFSLITEADYRNVVIFPEKFNGLYARLDRPHSEIIPWSIWISYSPDLRYWGDAKLIAKPVQYHWDEMKIGPGAPPIKIGVCDDWILQPEEYYEITGYVHNVVFTCGAVSEDNGTVKIYWGGADTVICAGTANIDDLVDLCLTNSRKAI